MTTLRLEHLRRDLAMALRGLRRAPLFAVIVSAILAIGIGANTAVLGLIDTAFFRPLPVPHPDRMVQIFSGDARDGRRRPSNANSFPDYADLRAQTASLASLTAYDLEGAPLGDTLAGVTSFAALVDGNFFAVLGVRPVRGRFIRPDEIEPVGAHPVVVLGYAFWQSTLGGRDDVLGHPLAIGKRAFTIVGVAPRGFNGTQPEGRIDLWIPYTMAAEATGKPASYPNRDARRATIVGRLAPNVSLAQLQASLNVAARNLATQYPLTDDSLRLRAAPHATLASVEQGINGLIGFTMVWLMIALVHLIACSNVASLLLARAAARRHELGVRLCLGASRARILMHSLAESAVLAAAGSAGGVLVAYWLTGLITRMQFMSAMNSGIDARVLLLVAAVGVATTLIFGTLPAREAARSDPMTVLRAGGTRSSRRDPAGALIVAGQLALSLVLLVNAAVLYRGIGAVLRGDAGYDVGHVIVARVKLSDAGLRSPSWRLAYDEILARLRAVPGVRGAAAAQGVPLRGGAGWMEEARVAGYRYASGEPTRVSMQAVGPGYFAAIGAQVARGREFTPNDRSDSVGFSGFTVAVINQAMALKYWSGADPIGRQLTFRNKTATVVGVVKDLHDVSTVATMPRVYFPLLQWRLSPTFDVLVRTADDPAQLASAVRGIITSTSVPVAAPEIRTLADVRDDVLQVGRVGEIGLALCGAVALVLTMIGLYALVTLWAAERRMEIGIRLALGAPARSVHAVLLGGIGWLVALGAVGGLAGAAALVQAERAWWGAMFAFDPLAVLAAFSILAGVAVLTAFVPSLRATRVPPSEVLRAN